MRNDDDLKLSFHCSSAAGVLIVAGRFFGISLVAWLWVNEFLGEFFQKRFLHSSDFREVPRRLSSEFR